MQQVAIAQHEADAAEQRGALGRGAIDLDDARSLRDCGAFRPGERQRGAERAGREDHQPDGREYFRQLLREAWRRQARARLAPSMITDKQRAGPLLTLNESAA